MPKMGGEHCLREILKLNSEARVLIDTGFLEYAGSDAERLSSGIIPKPYKAGHLLAKVREVLDAS